MVAGANAAAEPPRWYRGNTHAHTELCGHADSSPEAVARWYHDRGYNFLCLSEHNRFIDPATVPLPPGRREDFILVPGQEITGKRVIHTTALNVGGVVVSDFVHEHKSAIIQNHVDGAIAAGGTPILNHPNFHWAVAAEDLLPVERLHLFELYNGHPDVHNFGDEEHPGTEELWDTLLTAGMVVYGVSSDDAHQFKTWDVARSNPGRGWVMVRAEELSPGAITDALLRGDFYATSGVMLADVAVTEHAEGRVLTVVVDRAATEAELAGGLVIGRRVDRADEGWRIEAIGPGGEVLHTVRGEAATFVVTPEHAYVRCKITYARPDGAAAEEFYAWTQPVFTDGRLERLERPEPARAP